MRLTYVNYGTTQNFRAEQMTRHYAGNRGTTMLQAAADEVLFRKDEHIYLLGPDGRQLAHEIVVKCAATGAFPMQ